MRTKPQVASSIIDYEAFSILEFLPRPSGSKTDDPAFLPKIVQRKHDGIIFVIGEDVTNGDNYQDKPCRGKIIGFDFLEGKIFVNHTWSGIGWNLGSLAHVVVLPCEHQIDDRVWFNMWSASVGATVNGVHFYPKVKYDIEVVTGGDPGHTRLYNVDATFISKTKK